jgi:ribonuclease VapC
VFAYALAKATGEPLLFDGDDFAQTDIASAA